MLCEAGNPPEDVPWEGPANHGHQECDGEGRSSMAEKVNGPLQTRLMVGEAGTELGSLMSFLG